MRNTNLSMPAGRELSLRKKLAFSLIAVLLFFLALEAFLRVAGLGSPPVIGSLRFGYKTGIPRFDSDGIEYEARPFQDFPLFTADPILFWKPIANSPFTGPDGLRLPAPSEHSKSEGVIRLAVVGDSCSFLGREPYIQRFADMAQRERSQPVETINASCPGYTSLQGLRRLDDVWDWEPDWLVVYFGWNDHWNSLTGRTDAELASLRVFEPWQARLQKFHIYWAMSRIVGGRNRPRSMQARTVRVPLAEYGENLKQIAAAAQQRGCRVVYITAPTAFVEDQLPDWIYPFFGEYYEMSPEEIRAIPAVHRQYNELVRQTAAETGQLVLDLEAIWPPEQSAFRFRRDCIHLTEKGHEDAARALFELWMTSTANSGSSKDSRE